MHTCMPAHTHTRTVQTDRGDGQCCLAEIFGEEKCLEFAFEGRESSRVPGVLGKIGSHLGNKVCKSQACVCLMESEKGWKD